MNSNWSGLVSPSMQNSAPKFFDSVVGDAGRGGGVTFSYRRAWIEALRNFTFSTS